MITPSHLRTLVINIEVSGVIGILVGDLQPVRMTNLLWLKGGVQVLDGDYSFRAFGLLDRKHTFIFQLRFFRCVSVLVGLLDNILYIYTSTTEG